MSEGRRFVDKLEKKEIDGVDYVLMYERHNYTRHNPENLNNLNCLFLEGTRHGDAFSSISGSELTDGDVYKVPEIVRKIKEKEIPVYFMDVNRIPVFSDVGKIILTDRLVLALSIALSATLATSAVNKRSFLKGIFSTIFAAKATPPIILGTLKKPSPTEDPTQVPYYKSLTKFDELINPETNYFVLTFRNLVWAYKIKAIIKGIGIEHPEVGVILGAAHLGLEEYLKLDKEILLKKIKDSVAIFKSVGADMKGISDCSSVRFTTSFKYEKVDFPELLLLET